MSKLDFTKKKLIASLNSPKRLIDIISGNSLLEERLNRYDADWFFTKAGKKAYKQASTPAKKVLYFYDYLTAVYKAEEAKKTSYRTYQDDDQLSKKHYQLAYILATCIDSSSLEFAGYPNILDPEKNPLIKCVKNDKTSTDYLLAALNSDDTVNAEMYYKIEEKPYTHLTYIDKNGDMSDMYKLQRYIIAMGGISPYRYDIIKSSTSDSDDDEEENEEGSAN